MSSLPASVAVVFDLDGVLWDTSPVHEAAYRTTLEPLGLRLPPYSLLAGRRTDEVVGALLRAAGRHADQGQVEALTAEKRRRAHALLTEHPPIRPTVPLLLRRLAARRRLALASSASPHSVELFLAASGTADLFEVVLSASEPCPPKPAPAIYLLALERLRLRAEDVVVVEDSLVGVCAARAAGLRVIGVSGTTSSAELIEAGASHVLESVEGLVA